MVWCVGSDHHSITSEILSTVEIRGQVLIPSVVCTPETAGGGIEYAWGKLKFQQRRENDMALKLESGVKFFERLERLCKNK